MAHITLGLLSFQGVGQPINILIFFNQSPVFLKLVCVVIVQPCMLSD